MTEKNERTNATEETGSWFEVGIDKGHDKTKRLTIRQGCVEKDDDIFISIPEHALERLFRIAKMHGFDLGDSSEASDAEIIWGEYEEAVLLCLYRKGADSMEISSFLDRPYAEVLDKLVKLELADAGREVEF